MQGEGISTLRACHKGRQPLIECANHDFNIFLFSLLSLFSIFIFLCISPFYVFFYLFGVYKGVSLAPTYSSIAMRKSDRRSCLRTKGLFVTLILSFLKD